MQIHTFSRKTHNNKIPESKAETVNFSKIYKINFRILLKNL